MSSVSCLLLAVTAVLAGVPQPLDRQAPHGGPAPEVTAGRLANAGQYTKALALLRETARAPGASPVTQARALAWQARIEVDRGDFAAAAQTLTQAGLRAEASGDAEARARVHFARGLLHERRQTTGLGGDPEFARARGEYTAALALAESAGLGWRALARFRVGVAAERLGDDAAADRVYAEVIEEARRGGDVEAQSFADLHRANIAWRAGRMEGMRAEQERLREVASKAGLLFVESSARINLADLTGGEAGARAALQVAERLKPFVQGLPGMLDSAYAYALETAAEFTRERDPARARALFQRALAHAESSGLVAARVRLREALAMPADAGAP
ncbi:hypothetical protein FJV41_47750 [Myxococcus llanfairpwllgwyngyllgogerychwyrndrobwllllantysiliogogogochensis]|uniref:Tetratricopeptide repeat protein n=1 Tax=Myxococcus llanfairpwllgwyngyllgogerychwyrndrobwllllantysiliogogogochensis TaxID=2590453 RepID=A0A540WIX6_9BACT|nr:hypothetical protein [Myxococcus llanfairpwllgwyngyllgogerychwyrndrobwllllantysiliogogogochensis]TQF08847.1 hypothetical protein FJV41_47750 [Myxococcus llanfairpwllgwyngyllgogerychwyrndrobwllllantysiliogogogochensis]